MRGEIRSLLHAILIMEYKAPAVGAVEIARRRARGERQWGLALKGRHRHERKKVHLCTDEPVELTKGFSLRKYTENLKADLLYATVNVNEIKKNKERAALEKKQRHRAFAREALRLETMRQREARKLKAHDDHRDRLLAMAQEGAQTTEKQHSEDSEGCSEASGTEDDPRVDEEVEGVPKDRPMSAAPEPIRKHTNFAYTFRPLSSTQSANVLEALPKPTSTGELTSSLRSDRRQKWSSVPRFTKTQAPFPNIAPHTYQRPHTTAYGAAMRFANSVQVQSAFRKPYFYKRSQEGLRQLEELWILRDRQEREDSSTLKSRTRKMPLSRMSTQTLISVKRKLHRRRARKATGSTSPIQTQEPPLYTLPIASSKPSYQSPFLENNVDGEPTWEELELLYSQTSPLRHRPGCRRPGESPFPTHPNPFLFDGKEKKTTNIKALFRQAKTTILLRKDAQRHHVVETSKQGD